MTDCVKCSAWAQYQGDYNHKCNCKKEKKMPCECLGKMAGLGRESFGAHHHKNCDGYAAEKNPYLFFYDNSVDMWLVSDELDDYVSSACNGGDSIEVELKHIELTDKEYDELPED